MSDLFTDDQPEKKTRTKKEKAEVIDINESGPVESQGTELAVISASTDVIVLDPEISTETLLPAVVFKEGGSVDVLAKLRETVLAVPTDISTPKGRQAVKSLCYKIARSKTALDDSGKELGDKLRAMLNPILDERRKIRDGCDALAEEVRAPLTAWEASEEKRTNAHHDALDAIDRLEVFDTESPTSAQVKERLEQLDHLPDRDWQEFIQRAVEMKKGVRADLEQYLKEAQAREEAAAEIARMEAEAAAAEAERLRLEREAEIAAAAEAAKIEAERLAKEEADRVAEQAEAERQRLEDQRQAEEAARLEAQRLLKEAEERAEENRKAAHRLSLIDIVTLAGRACSEFNSAASIKSMQDEFERHWLLTRNFEEFQPEADETIASCRDRIAAALKKTQDEEAARAAKATQDAADEADRVRQAGIREEARRRDEALEQERLAADARARDEKRRKEVRDNIAAALLGYGGIPTLGRAEEIADALMAGKVPHVTVIF